MKIRTILVDDENSSLIILKTLLEKHTPDVEIIGTAKNVEEAVNLINETKPDLVFLDINLPDGDGFLILEKAEYKDFKVIFSTAYDQYAIRAFEVSALHYLLKPIKPQDLKDAVNRYHQSEDLEWQNKMDVFNNALQQKQSRLVLPTSGGIHIIDINDIVRCESSNNYTTFYLADKHKIVVSKPINFYEAILSESHFCRLHNKHIVNLNYIKKYVKGRGGYVELTDGSQVDVSEGRKKDFIEKLNQFTLNKL